jgi:hypothetical protein
LAIQKKIFLLDRSKSQFHLPPQGCQMVYFKTKKSQFGLILDGLTVEDVGLFYGRLVCFIAIGYILCILFGIFFPLVGMYKEKSGNPGLPTFSDNKMGTR